MSNEKIKLLEMTDISKTYPGAKALQKVEFELLYGEVHALIGENGAGKSTLIKILMGIANKDEGSINIDGKQAEIMNPVDAASLGVAAVFQEMSLIPTLTVAENVYLCREFKKTNIIIDRKSMIEETKKIIDKYGIDLNPEEKVSDLSIAKRQLAEILKAIVMNPRILILDEPTASLTNVESEILFSIIKDFKARKAGVIYISHRMNEIFQISDRVTVLRDGCYIDTCVTENLNMDKVVKLMVGREVSLFQSTSRKYLIKEKKKALEIKNISKEGSFNKISFFLNKGEILGFAGLVGSGRTELMNIIFGIDQADSGDIIINDKSVKISSVSDAIENGIIMVPESRHLQGLILMHNIESNIILPLLKKFIKFGIFLDFKKIKNFAEKQMEIFNIKAENRKQIVNYLSGGNQQKVVVAKALALEPKILIVDELTAGIDIHSKTEIHKIIRSIADKGVSIIMISSEMPELLANSDRIIVMNNKKIVGVFDETDQEEIMSVILADNMKNKMLRE